MDAQYEQILTNEDPRSKFQLYSEHFTECLLESPKLYKHQKDAISKVKTMNDGDNPSTQIEPIVVVAPTGSGKSGIIFMLPYVLKSSRVLIITPSKVISKQLAETFGIESNKKCFLQSVGLCPSDESKRKAYLDKVLESGKVITSSEQVSPRPGNLVIINAQKFSGSSNANLNPERTQSNAQKRSERLENRIKNQFKEKKINTPTELQLKGKKNPVNRQRKFQIKVDPHVEEFFEKFDTLIVDEAHHYPAATWEDILSMFRNSGEKVSKKVIFLTATPYRKINGQKEFILGRNMKSRIAYQIESKDLEGKFIRHSDFKELPCSEDWGTEKVIPERFLKSLYKDITNIFDKNLEREPRLKKPQAMILVSFRHEAIRIARELNKNGDTEFARSTLGGAKGDPMKSFKEGKFKVAVTCGVGLEGYDNSNVILCVILRKIGEGTVLLEQFIGRCGRLKGIGEGNTDKSIGVILSYTRFGVKAVYDNMKEVIADYDPVEIDDDEGGNSEDEEEIGGNEEGNGEEEGGNGEDEGGNGEFESGEPSTKMAISEPRTKMAKVGPSTEMVKAGPHKKKARAGPSLQ